MKKFLTVTAIFIVTMLVVAQCSSKNDYRRDATTVGKYGWVFEGWACAPQADMALRGVSPAEYCRKVKEADKDYLYMKTFAAASPRAIQQNMIAMKATTCKDAAETQFKGNTLSKIVGDYLEQASGVADGQSTGVAIVRQSQGLVRGVGVYDCCSINPETGVCVDPGVNETWEQCMCVGYIRWRGGQKAFESMAEKASSF